VPRRNRFCLLDGKPQRMVARQLSWRHSFVDMCGINRVGFDADAVQEVEAAGARRSQDQAHQACPST